MSMEEAKKNRKAPPDTPSNLGSNASKDIAAALTALLADVFALHVTTKNCHWHISGQYFRDYRSEEHTSELQSLMRISYAVFCLKKKKTPYYEQHMTTQDCRNNT